jgi:hypothetical protein
MNNGIRIENGKLIAQPTLPDPLPDDLAATASRIAREAGEVYVEALRKRH